MSLYIRYFKVLIQEMNLKIDLGFLYALLDLNPSTVLETGLMTSEQEVSCTHLCHSQGAESGNNQSWHSTIWYSLSFHFIPAGGAV